MATLDALGFAALGALVFLYALVLLAVYVYSSLTLMIIANKTKTKKAWLAWIPIANIYLMTQIAKVPWWTMLFLLLVWIPFAGYALAIGLTIWYWWNISEARNLPGWLGILMAVPTVNLIVMGIIAWKD